MEDGKFYRINIKFLEPNKLSSGFLARYQREVETNSIYLGIRFNPTNFNRSAAINSRQIAFQCMSLVPEYLLYDYGDVDCNIREFPCSTEFMQSIIDTDTRTLMSYTQDKNFTSRLNGIINDNRIFAQKI